MTLKEFDNKIIESATIDAEQFEILKKISLEKSIIANYLVEERLLLAASIVKDKGELTLIVNDIALKFSRPEDFKVWVSKEFPRVVL